MNSFDPWRLMLSSPPGEQMIVPTPFYGHPFYDAQGTFVGNDLADWIPGFAEALEAAKAGAPVTQRRGLAAEIAPVVAPATGGLTAKVELDARQCLCATICVDGKCYSSSMDLGPAIAAVLAKIAAFHADLHAAMPGVPAVSGELCVGAVERAVAAARNALIGSLIDRHVRVACGGWLDDLGDAIKGAGSSVYQAAAATLQKFKGPITEAAKAEAAKYGGDVAGDAAAQLVGPVIDSAANAGKDTPQKAAAEQQAAVDPVAAAALSTAKDAAARTIAAYHVSETAQQAAAGHPEAQQQVAQVVQDAERGDPAARAAAPLVRHGFETAAARRHHRRQHGHGHHHPLQLDPLLVQETDRQFWARTHYKPGQRLNPRDPQDAQWLPRWMDIYRGVARSHSRGTR
jgi:hypothetical protein